MTEPREEMRRSLIEEELIHAVQTGKLTNRERLSVTELLKYNDWKLDHLAGMLSDLRNRVSKACPHLAVSAPALHAKPEPPTEPRTTTNKPRRLGYDPTFQPGFTPPTEN